MKLDKITEGDALYVCERLRAADADEIYALRWDEDPASLARDTAMIGRFGWVAKLDDGEPTTVLGGVPMWPGVWSVYAYGTDKMDRTIQDLTKHIKRVMMPTLRAQGAHRVEARSIDTHRQAHRWLEWLGAEVEFTLQDYGRNREAFRVYVWRA